VGMGKISRVDRAIGAALLALMAGLLALAIVHRSDQAHSALPPLAPASPSTASTSSNPASGATSTPGTAGTASTATTAAAANSGNGQTPAPVNGSVSAVGDSILLDIQPYLQTEVPAAHIDGLVSRQFETGIGVVQAERAAGTLGTVLVVELGTNGSVTASDFDAMMQAASGAKRVVFVNINVPRSWMAPDNAVLAAGVARYPGVAELADWNALSTGHPEWFTPDQVHLQPAGAQALANLVAQYA
jgi:lysophospholipase L1-like esterase